VCCGAHGQRRVRRTQEQAPAWHPQIASYYNVRPGHPPISAFRPARPTEHGADRYALTPEIEARMIQMTLKNYQCFSQQTPLVINLEPGFTALVGPNNSGKSALLKFFYYFKTAFDNLRDPEILRRALTQSSNSLNVQLRTITDPRELICNLNASNIHVCFKYIAPPPLSRAQTNLVQVELTSVGGDPKNLVTSAILDPDQSAQTVRQGKIIDSSNREVNSEHFQSMFYAFRNPFYAPSFRNAINVGEGTYYDIDVGTSLVKMLT